MDWFAENPWLAWLGLALILAAIEAATVDFVFLMLAGGAAGRRGGVGASGCAFPVQVVVAVVVAGLLLLLVRPVITKKFMVAEASHGIGAPGLVGRSGAGAADGHRDRRSRQGGRGDLVRTHAARRRPHASPAKRSGLYPSRGPP